MRPYEALVQFIASLSSREVVDFKPSEAARQCVWDLIARYTLVHEEDAFWGCRVDHIISRKHGGASEPGQPCLGLRLLQQRKGQRPPHSRRAAAATPPAVSSTL
ncbi:MAG: hypothetical protein ABI651_05365 [Verrucomicrobiota bacterium]